MQHVGTAPLTAVQLLRMNMIMDTLGALALATEPPNDEMKRPPVRRGDSFITRVMWRNIPGQALYQLLILGVLMFAGKRLLNIEGPDADRTIDTLIFNSFVFCHVCEIQSSLRCVIFQIVCALQNPGICVLF
jgi:P-type Ca2+ transporter type 2C